MMLQHTFTNRRHAGAPFDAPLSESYLVVQYSFGTGLQPSQMICRKWVGSVLPSVLMNSSLLLESIPRWAMSSLVTSFSHIME